MPRYRNDPRRITARSGRCKRCNKDLRNQPALYWPISRDIFCAECGKDDYQRFLCAAADEALATGSSY